MGVLGLSWKPPQDWSGVSPEVLAWEVRVEDLLSKWGVPRTFVGWAGPCRAEQGTRWVLSLSQSSLP